jgi:O-antigen/teichoic acid export membrane protein
MVASLLTLIFSFLVIKGSGSLFFLVVAIIGANILAVTLSFALVRPLVTLDFSLSWPILRRITLEALPMGGILILFSVYNRIDALILQAIKGSTAVGIYGLSYRVYEVLVLGAFYLMNSLLPVISREKDRGRLRLLYQRALDILILAGTVVVLGTLIMAPLAIRVIALKRFAEFSQSIPLLRILSLAVFVSFLNH